MCGAGQLGFRTSLQLWHAFLNRFAECASCPEGCLAQPSNLGLGHVPELPIPAPLKCGEGKGHPEHGGRTRLHAQENTDQRRGDPQFNESSTQYSEEQPCAQQTGRIPLRESCIAP